MNTPHSGSHQSHYYTPSSLQLKVDRRVKLEANNSYEPTVGISKKDEVYQKGL